MIITKFQRLISLPGFAKWYMAISLLVLLASTVIWSILGASLHSANADQLINVFLFEDFDDAVLPGQHSFLLKWPLFWLVKLFEFSPGAFVVVTVMTVLATISALVAFIYKIERRPLIFGTLCLALASVLALVPAQPHNGGLLPVNMAMLTTRNLEYILFIVSLYIFLAAPRVKSWLFWLAIILMTVLAASDKLFLVLGLGGALLALVVYALSRGWNLVSLSVHWLLGGIIALVGALGLLWLLDSANIVNIVNQSNAGPYTLVDSVRDAVLGTVYAGLGLLTNFGANPAFDVTVLRDVPSGLLNGLSSLAGGAYIVNGLVLAAGAFASWRLIRLSLYHNRDDTIALDGPSRLSIMLIWTSLAAVGAFVFTNHYYAVDARYLTISLFAVFIALATIVSKRAWSTERVVLAGLVLVVATALGLFGSLRTYSQQQAALQPINQRNLLVAQALNHHPVTSLVGDYWRVLPVKYRAGHNLKVTPLTNCFVPRDLLTSRAWQLDLNKSFAYLLTLDGNLTDYPDCTLEQVFAEYGKPNTSILIAGTLEKPKEMLLFYDGGAKKSEPKATSNVASTVSPITFDQLPNNYCPTPTTMNIVAHEDDDILFLSPDLIHNLHDGHCVRTIYMTAGDAGADHFYWLSRRRGIQAAYSKMIQSSDIWVERTVKLADNQFLVVTNPRGNDQISLIFMGLPDGNLKGQGYGATEYQSLESSEANKTIKSVDGQSNYNSDQIVSALTTVMHTYEPAEIKTQSDRISARYPDHSDHTAAGRYAQKAHDKYVKEHFRGLTTIPISYYLGYHVNELPENVHGQDLADKEAAFLEYAKFDSGVCQSTKSCQSDPAYGSYLRRQYRLDQ